MRAQGLDVVDAEGERDAMEAVRRHGLTLSTRGLLLRPVDPEADAGALHTVFGVEAELAYMLRAPCPSEAETASLLRCWNLDERSPQWAIVEADAVVGRITLVWRRDGVFEVGVQVVPRARSRGVATRAILGVTTHAFEHLDACRVYADIDPGNRACARAFQRAGFRFEGTLVANFRTPRGIFDSEIHAATAGWTPPA